MMGFIHLLYALSVMLLFMKMYIISVLTADRLLTGEKVVPLRGQIDTRERMLLLMQMLNLPHGITVPEFQHYCMHSFGVAPNRKSVYQDLYAIEKYVPLVILRPKDGKTVYKYSFSGEGESE